MSGERQKAPLIESKREITDARVAGRVARINLKKYGNKLRF